jgi:lactate dehydrogenase-like 2-hydroxyacid dehydrogenase
VALRCAGYNNVDLGAAEAHGITVVRVPAYSPYAVAEFTVGVSLALDRQICRGWRRVREDNFSLEVADLEAGRPDPVRLVKAATAIAPPRRVAA